jgi:hypothetical protein
LGNSGNGNDDDNDDGPTQSDDDIVDAPYILEFSEGVVVIIMPPGSNPTMTRSNFFKRLGTSLSIAGFLFDIGEMATIFDLLPGDEDGAALADLVVTYGSGLSGGQNYFFERPDESLPYMLTANQDVIVTAGDAGLAGLAKIVGGAVGGPAGYAVGEGADVITTGASILYDGNRNFGSLKSYISVGVAITTTEQINCGDTLILIWP